MVLCEITALGASVSLAAAVKPQAARSQGALFNLMSMTPGVQFGVTYSYWITSAEAAAKPSGG